MQRAEAQFRCGLVNHVQARIHCAAAACFAVHRFEAEMVVAQAAGQGDFIADIGNGFGINADILFGLITDRRAPLLEQLVRTDFLMAVVQAVFQQNIVGNLAVQINIRAGGDDFGVGRTRVARAAGIAVARIIGRPAVVHQAVHIGIGRLDEAQIFPRPFQIGVVHAHFACRRCLTRQCQTWVAGFGQEFLAHQAVAFMLLVQVAQCDAVVVESRADFGQIAGFVQRAVRHGSCAIQPIVVAAAAFVGVVFGIAAGQQIIKLARFAKQRQAEVMAVVGCVAGVHFGTEIRIAAVFQQIGGIQRFGDNRAVGLPDTGRCAACTFLHGDNFHHGRVEHVATLVVVDLAVCVGIVHFHINRVLPHAADIQERRRAVAAAEANG